MPAATIAGSASKTHPISPPSSPPSAGPTTSAAATVYARPASTPASFLEALAVRGQPLVSKTTRLLRLLDQVGAPAAPPIDLVFPADPRVRDLRVTPHTLSAYDTLLAPAAPEETPDGFAR